MDGITVRRSSSVPRNQTLDWPLSHEEKKGCVLRLFDRDVQAANEVIRSSEQQLEALQFQLRKASSAVVSQTAEEQPKLPVKNDNPDHAEDEAADAAAKLRAAIASATAALKALEGKTAGEDRHDDEEDSLLMTPEDSVRRSRSEGPQVALVGILCKDSRRHSRGRSTEGLKRRVSFGRLPNESSESPKPSKDDKEFSIEEAAEPTRRLSTGLEPEPELFTPESGQMIQGPQVAALAGGWKPSPARLAMRDEQVLVRSAQTSKVTEKKVANTKNKQGKGKDVEIANLRPRSSERQSAPKSRPARTGASTPRGETNGATTPRGRGRQMSSGPGDKSLQPSSSASKQEPRKKDKDKEETARTVRVWRKATKETKD
eukprot:TRINITY_DN3411_c0_g1_i11.p1 TRINITY_DN3411_c0_g1~~TRINITY_DN3411_c0_g1_i11.p1  ORF type:complete len:373 (-),score=88.42 TRINITY_DN3411_c0_g1_i11:303-1421(-)